MKSRKWPKGCAAARLKIGLCLVAWMQTTSFYIRLQLSLWIESPEIRKNLETHCFTGEETTKSRLHFEESNHPKCHQEKEGQMLEPHITAHSGIRGDRLCPFIAECTSFTVIINQRHQYLTELDLTDCSGKGCFWAFLLFMVRGFYVT